MGVIDLKFSIDGNKVLEPVNWQELTEVYEFGNNSNQPAIEAENFTFQGDGASHIFNHLHPNGILKAGNILVPMSLNVDYTQNGVSASLMEDYILDPTDTLELNDNSFNGDFTPKEIVCGLRKKDGSDYFLTELGGLTWGLLLEEGAVTSSDYTTVKTIVVPLYSLMDVATIILTIYSLQKQARDSFDAIKKSIADTTDRLSEGAITAVGAGLVLAVAFVVIKTAVEIAGAIILLGLLVVAALDIILLAMPPVLKNKGITLRRGMEIICNRLGYNFNCSIDLLDKVVYMPSGAHSEGKNIIKKNLPNWFGNDRGIPNQYDNGYIAVQFVEIVKKLVNGLIDVKGSTVYLKTESDKSLFKEGTYSHALPVNYRKVLYNIDEIPHTRLISLAIDETDGYTTEYQKGRMYEVKNISKDGNLPFKQSDLIDIDCALGHRKEKLFPIEKLIVAMAGVADNLAGFLGKNTKLEEKVKDNRLGMIVVTQNNFGKPKLVPIVGGKVPSNHLDILSAERIEKDFYSNRSIVRGTGQKMIIPNVELVMSLADREKVKNNKNFLDPFFGECQFRRVEDSYAKDTAICDILINNCYIASNTFEEVTYDGS